MNAGSEKINEINEAEEPAKDLLRKVGYTYVPRDMLATERNREREDCCHGADRGPVGIGPRSDR